MSMKTRNQIIGEVKRKDYGMIVGNLKGIEEMIRGSVDKVESRKAEQRKVNKFVNRIIEAQGENGQYYAIEGVNEEIRGSQRQEGRQVIVREGTKQWNQRGEMVHNLKEMRKEDVERSKVRIERKEGSTRMQGLQSRVYVEMVKRSLKQTMVEEGRLNTGGAGIEFQHEANEVSHGVIYDDMSGKALNEDQVKIARAEEMEEVKQHKVYVKVPIEQCLQETGKMPIGTRWVDIRKGDDVNLEYRSRLVAQELKKNSVTEDLFAATPPLEAKKILFSMAVTEGVGFNWKEKEKGLKIDFIENSIFLASSGGVAANRSSVTLFFFNSCATNLDRYSRFTSSPLLMSTHRVPIGIFPVS
jgi:hypothetical protein